MTTPNQPIPQTLETLLGFGAFQLGGGVFRYGQTLTEDITRSLIAGAGTALTGAFTTIEEFIQHLGAYLLTLPLEALQWMRQFIPGSVLSDFDTITGAVDTIIAALHLDNVAMQLEDFLNWVSSTYNILETEVHQVIDAFSGAVIVPITSRVAGFLDWLDALTHFRSETAGTIATLLADFAGLISGVGGTLISDVTSAIVEGVLAASQLITLITGLGGAAITDVVDLVAGAVADVATSLAHWVTLISGLGGATVSDVVAAIGSGVTALSRIASLISGTGGTTITDVVTSINDAYSHAASALSDLSSLITGLGGTTISDTVTFLSNASTKAISAFNAIASLISGVGGAVIGDVAGTINTSATGVADALAKLAALITGVGGTAISDVVALINLVQQIIDAIAHAFGHAGTGHTPGQIQGYLANIPATVINNVLGGANLGADLQAIVTQATAALGGSTTTLAGLATQLQNIPAPNIPALVQSFGATFPKTFPWTPGVSTNTALSPPVLQSDFQQLLDGIAGQAGATVQHAVAALETNTAAVQSNVSQAVVDGVHAIETNAAGAAQALQGMFGGFLALAGIPSTSATPAQVQSAATAAYQQLNAHTQTIAAINGELNTSGGGLNVSLPVTPGTLPSSFTDMGTFTLNDFLSLITPSMRAAKYNVATATSDAMSVTTISSDGTMTFNILRADSAFSNFAYLATYQSGANIFYEIGYFLSGVQQTFLVQNITTGVTKANNSIEFLCDTGYDFEFELNGVPQASVTDTGHAITPGSSFRNLGFGVASATLLPGPVTQISAAAQAATIGSGFRAYRSSTSASSTWTTPATSTVTVGSGVWNLNQPPASCYDTIQAQTTDIAFATSTNTVTVGVAGWYEVVVAVPVASTGSAFNAGPALWHNGVLFALGQISTFPSSGFFPVQASFTVYCAAGDTLTPGLASTGSWNAYGDTGGTSFYFSVTLANCGTLS